MLAGTVCLRIPALAIAALALGCGAEDLPQDPCAGPPPAFEVLGTGDLDSGLQPLADGDPLPLTLAFNGAHTVMVGGRLRAGFALDGGDGPRVPVTVALRADDQIVGGAIANVQPQHTGGALELLGIRTQLTHELDSLDASLSLGVDVTAEDACGRVAHMAVQVQLTH